MSCDNLRACSAFGLEAQDNPNAGYVTITRAGDAAAAPAVAFHFPVDEAVRDPRLQLALVGQASGVLPTDLVPAPGGNATLDTDRVAPFLASLMTATTLTMALLDGSKPSGSSQVSLAGASAALRFMDAEQRRAGGVTALAAKGSAAADAVPPPPAKPVIAAQAMTQLAAPLPRPPAGVRASRDCLSGSGAASALLAFQLSPGQTLWGACDAWGAYNAEYRFFVAGRGRATPVGVSGYDVPGQKPRPNAKSILVSPTLSSDGKTLSSIAKDEGLGDCGVASSWAWDGRALRLVELRAMPVCRGVNAGDWPVVYTAATQ